MVKPFSRPDYEDPPVEPTLVMPGAPRASGAADARAPMPSSMGPLPEPKAPPAPPSDRVLLPDRPASVRPLGAAPASMPGWVTFYAFVALALALVGGCVLFLESRIVGHF
jgi:hypothetical protein